MRKVCLFLFSLQLWLLQAVDYDCIVIGTSPIAMLEAIYQHDAGKSVLLVDRWLEPGGAWKSITACQISHVDMGCHQLVGADWRLKEFLEDYVGCRLVSMQKPLESCTDPNCSDFYFSQGCYELIRNLEQILATTQIEVLLNHLIEEVLFQGDSLLVKGGGKEFSTKKIITVPGSYFQVEGVLREEPMVSKFWHLYLLVEDFSAPSFSYRNYAFSGICRCMNLTHFVGLTDSGKQLFVFQAYDEKATQQGEEILKDFKRKNWIGAEASILQSDVYIYEQFPYNMSWYNQLEDPLKEYFEVLDTSIFGSISRYMDKWTAVMRLYRDRF